MKPITPDQLLEQIELGAEVLPGDSPYDIGVQVGRFQYTCDLEQFTLAQRSQLEQLYTARRIRFGYPGDFTDGRLQSLPFFFRCPPNTRTIRL
jgi:hypothetical protein